MSKLTLKRPIIFFDLETTGVDHAKDRIVELAMVKIFPDGKREKNVKRINPGIPIPPEVTLIHGISDEDVKNCPPFKQVAHNLYDWMRGCDLAGYNSSKFDLPLLAEEFLRVGINVDFTERHMIDVQQIFFKMEARTLSAAYAFYCQKELENAHSAEADAVATWEILEAQVIRYPQIGDTVESIVKFTGEDDIVDFARRFIKENGVEIFNFGKHKGKPVVQVLKEEPQYYDWMMKGDFAMNTKQKLTEILNRTLVKKP